MLFDKSLLKQWADNFKTYFIDAYIQEHEFKTISDLTENLDIILS